jgi:hypothetical protein
MCSVFFVAWDIVVIAMPISLLSSKFSAIYDQNQLKKKAIDNYNAKLLRESESDEIKSKKHLNCFKKKTNQDSV